MVQSSNSLLYQEAKAGVISLIKQTALVFFVFAIMLLLTGGNPPGGIVGLTFCLTVVFVARVEGRRRNPTVTRKQQLALLRRGIHAWNGWRSENSTIEINLSGLDLRGLDLRGADLRSANLHEAFLSEANLSEADLNQANFTKAILRRANFTRSNLHKVNLSRADLYTADFDRAKVQQALFSNNPGLTDKEKAALMERGAVFQDSPESQVSV